MSSVRVIAIGDSAERLLGTASSNQSRFRCIAVFQRSLYLELRPQLLNNIICVSTTDLPLGPLTTQVQKNDFDRLCRSSAITSGKWQNAPLSRWLDHRAAMVWNSSLTDDAVSLMPEPVWLRALLSHCPAESVLQHLDHSILQVDKRPSVQKEKIRDSLTLAQRDYFRETLQRVKQSLMRLLANSDSTKPHTDPSGDAEIAAPLIKLAGAGRGLTPAGDDALGGIFIALATLGKQSAIERLTRSVLPEVRTRTHAISHALLLQAAAGRADESVHLVIGNMSQAQLTTVKQSATLLSRMGQTSGWDTLAGMLLAINASDQSCIHLSDQQQQSIHA